MNATCIALTVAAVILAVSGHWIIGSIVSSFAVLAMDDKD